MPPLSLPIFNESYRPSSNWAQEVTQQQAALAKLAPLAPEIKEKINDHFIAEEVKQNLLLGDIDIDKAENQRTVQSFAEAVRYLHDLISTQSDRSQFMLTSDLLRELHARAMAGVSSEGGKYRSDGGRAIAAGHTPAEADLLPFLLDNALGWFSAQSFQELHPLEQAWLVHLRLIELQPFAQANGRIARLCASFYALRADLGPIIVSAADRELYQHALNNSFQMITQPGVELFARSVVRTLTEAIAIASH